MLEHQMFISQRSSLAGNIKAIDPLVSQPIFNAYSVPDTVLVNTFGFMSVLSSGVEVHIQPKDDVMKGDGKGWEPEYM